MSWSNYDDVLSQLRDAGLLVDTLQIGSARPVRCKVEGAGREKRGWYRLHELPLSSGDLVLVGSFGVWHGNSNGAQKIELRKSEISSEQREALRRRWADDRKRADEQLRADQARAAEKASEIWAGLEVDGDADYLAEKRVQGFGLRYTKNGSAVLPLLDTAGRIHGLQFLRTASMAKEAKRPAKEFFPPGLAKKGHFHLIGSPSWVVIVGEGYATCATLHMATQLPVAVAFDAGNIPAVVDALRKRYPRTKILVAADDDILGKCRHCRERIALTLHPKECPSCGKEHQYENAGVNAASAGAMSANGAWIAPAFDRRDALVDAWLSRGDKANDFNDLYLREGLHVVRVQIEGILSAKRWDAKAAAGCSTSTAGAGSTLRPIQTLNELLDRYALIYGHSGSVFDRDLHCLLSLSDMRDACIRRDIHRAWMESADRSIVRVEEVGFDPGSEDPKITCNLWAGWPTEPREGSCEKLLDLLRYVCSEEGNSDDLYQWVLRWLAYPIQHPGAKMKSTLVLHGPQGTGKNLFFETYMSIFGQYGRVIGQDAVEDKFNDWASRKLFLIADEVAARSEVFHLKNKLKALITGDWIRINPKNIAAYDERNHVNLVFLSNEAMPVALEEDDRRHCVIWTPEERPRAFYAEVLAEIANGGAEALHHFLLNLDLGDFHNGARPPQTSAKHELIALGLDSPQRFYDDVMLGEVSPLKAQPGLSLEWYSAYKHWCSANGHRAAPSSKFINAFVRKRATENRRIRYRLGQTDYGPHFVLMFGNCEPPEGAEPRQWFGERIADHRKRMAAYRGKAADE